MVVVVTVELVVVSGICKVKYSVIDALAQLHWELPTLLELLSKLDFTATTLRRNFDKHYGHFSKEMFQYGTFHPLIALLLVVYVSMISFL